VSATPAADDHPTRLDEAARAEGDPPASCDDAPAPAAQGRSPEADPAAVRPGRGGRGGGGRGGGGRGGGRELLFAVIGCVLGAAIVVGLAGRPWVTVTERGATVLTQSLTGSSLNGAVAALGWAGLAGTAGLVATRGWLRVAVGVLLVAFGGGVTYLCATAVGHAHILAAATAKSQYAAVTGAADIKLNPLWIVTLAGGLLLALAGALTVARGRRWPGMSARYERTSAPPKADPNDPLVLWKTLDRGEDPTG
jgi:uncharacterized membrane protein (TIGR02234 family)